MEHYFDSLLKPRVMKALYASDWKSGLPRSRDGMSGLVKVVRLESYEDALNNLELAPHEEQQGLLDLAPAQGADMLKEQYILRYMLDVETRGSQSLLNVRPSPIPPRTSSRSSAPARTRPAR